MKYSNYSIFKTELPEIGLERALDRTLELGFDSVEHLEATGPREVTSYFINSVAEARAFKRELDARGLTLTCYSYAINFLVENIELQKERALRHIEYASILGSPFFHHTVAGIYDKTKIIYTLDEMYDRVCDNVEFIGRSVNEYGMTVLYEPQGLYVNRVEGVGKFLYGMKARGLNVGVCGDTANSLFADCMPIELYRAFAPDIKHIHVKDYTYGRPRGERFSVGGKQIDYERIGSGDCDLEGCFALIPDYDAAISFETVISDEEMKYAMTRVKEMVEKR